MDRLEAMRAFLGVADVGGFAEAARRLRRSSSSVTRAVAMIEADLGLQLFRRTTRSVQLTEAGLRYAERCRRILEEIEDAHSAMRGEETAPQGRLSITAPVLFGRMHVLPIVETLLAAHPALSIRLVLLDRVTHLVEEGFDAAVRIGPLADSALLAIPLAQVVRFVVASPSYLANAGTPLSPPDLKQHATIAFEGIDATDAWRFGTDGAVRVSLKPRLILNSADAAIDAATRGHGITHALSYQVEDALAAGRLVRLLQDFESAPIPVSIVCQAARRNTPNVAAFVAAARERLARRKFS